MTPKQIKALRNRLTLTQEQFAQHVGASVTTINRWERGVTIPRGLYADRLEEIDKQGGKLK